MQRKRLFCHFFSYQLCETQTVKLHTWCRAALIGSLHASHNSSWTMGSIRSDHKLPLALCATAWTKDRDHIWKRLAFLGGRISSNKEIPSSSVLFQLELK